MQESWDKYYLGLVPHIAEKSKDTSRKVGCILVGAGNEVLTTGYNGLPRGVNEDEARTEHRPEKYFWVEHAERNCVYNAARNGICLLGSTAYMNSLPCADCARAMIQAGVRRIVANETSSFSNSPMWQESMGRGYTMLVESGVEVKLYG
jgi:dCMP deaminase